MIKYQAIVTQIGPSVKEFIDAGILVFFGMDAPPEVVEFSIIHDGQLLKQDVVVGDSIFIDDEEFKVLAVGDVANTNFANLGHLIVKFNGQYAVELPGDVCVEGKPVPPIKIGTLLKVIGN